MLWDHVKSIDPAETDQAFATRIVGPDYCNAGRRAAEADGFGNTGPGFDPRFWLARGRDLPLRLGPDTIFRDGRSDFQT